MLLIKVIVALSVYQHYCIGKYIFSVDYDVGIKIYGDDLEITDDEFTANSDKNEITDDEFETDSHEKYITDDEFKADSHEKYITDDEFTANSHKNEITDDEFKADAYEIVITDDELTTKPDENTTTDGELPTKPDENPTTDSELTTKPDENPTTESGECPPEKSRISKNDIRGLVDSLFNDLGLNKSMIEHIVPETKNVNQKHSEDFDQFLNWFQSKPDHLKDVLQGLAAVREGSIEPVAHKIADILKDYPQVKENIQKKQLKLNELNKNLNKYDMLCKYQCDDQEPEPSHIFKRSIAEEYLCISLDDLREQVTKELEDNFDGFLNKTKENLRNMDQTFTETIKHIKDELSRAALKEFSRTMYLVLDLQKDYQSFVNEINSTNTSGLIYAAKEGELQVGSKLLELEKLIHDYKDYCTNCNKGPVKRSVRQTNLVINENENSKVSIVHELIQEKYIKSENVLNEIIEETFKDLNKLINDPKRTETYVNNLKLKENEIIEVANKERLDLEHLKSIAFLETIKKLSDLHSVSNDMLKNIDEKITHLKKIIK